MTHRCIGVTLALAAHLLGIGSAWAGTEGAGSTFYGSGAGANNSADGNLNTFVGANAGNHTTSGTYNAFFGEGAGYQNTTSSFNSFFGLNAGFSNTTGTQNVFLGYAAGYSSASADYNTFVGAGAGFLNTSVRNTFVGHSAGYSNTTGSFNVFLGDEAGYANTTGLNDLFVGSWAGHSNTSGSGNTFVGREAGYSNTIGSQNTFVGRQAGYANTSGSYNTLFGLQAGISNTTGADNTFIGVQAGDHNTTGYSNLFIGSSAGYSTTTGFQNTYVGLAAGDLNATGQNNVFIGYKAGLNELGSNKLYIDNCLSGGSCVSPFIYGEFDNHLLKVNGVLHARADGVAKSQMHFSQNDTDTGGFLTSVLDNNFFVSSGARYDGTAGGWIQRSPDTNAVIAGSGGVGYRVFTHTGTAVGSSFTPTLRLHIDYSGQFGINTTPVAGHEIHASSGAHLTSGGVWTDASSRELKDNIRSLSTRQALDALARLDPVTFNYKVNPAEKHVGFIAEDVPELVARGDRKSLSPMDIVAVLTRVVQEQERTIEEKSRAVEAQKSELAQMQQRLSQLAAAVSRLEQRAIAPASAAGER